MKSIFVCLALWNWPALGGDSASRRARAGVYVEFPQQSGEHVSGILRNEAESILSPLGFDLEGREDPPEGRETWAELAVVTFRGRCNLEGGEFPGFVPSALGWTEVIDGNIQPFVYIDCNRIGSLLQSWLLYAPAPKREDLFQRAIARVLTHELYHVFARNAAHKRSGVGKAEFTPLDLLSSKFRFQKNQAKALQESSSRGALQFYAGP